MKVVLSGFAKFHIFALAEELEKRGCLQTLYTGYPRWKTRGLKVSEDKVVCLPVFFLLYSLACRISSVSFKVRSSLLGHVYAAHERGVLRDLMTRDKKCDVFHGMSRHNLRPGRYVKECGGLYICDVGSAHILTQKSLLEAENAVVGLARKVFNEPDLRREQSEYRECDRILLMSKFAQKSFVENGEPLKKTSVIPPGVNLSTFNRVRCAESSRFVVLFVGALTVQKGIHTLISAFMRANIRDSELVLIGSRGAEADRLLSGTDRRITVLGHVEGGKLKNYYSTASVFVLPSIQDGYGMVVLEAMACGCAVVVSRNAGASDCVEENKTGVTFSAGDVGALEGILRYLNNNPRDRQRMALAGQSMVASRFGWPRYAENVLDEYRVCIDSK
jgi:starch synthase